MIDADLSGYFDSIPHSELMKSVARRIVDRHMLHLIKLWLEAPVEEDDGTGHGTDNDQPGHRARHAPRRAHLAAAVEPVHAAVRRWDGSDWGMSAAGRRTLSTTRTTS